MGNSIFPVSQIFWTFSRLLSWVHRYVCHCQKFSCNYFPLCHINGTGLLDYWWPMIYWHGSQWTSMLLKCNIFHRQIRDDSTWRVMEIHAFYHEIPRMSTYIHGLSLARTQKLSAIPAMLRYLRILLELLKLCRDYRKFPDFGLGSCF